MATTKVRHPADELCRDCDYFDLNNYEDSFGPVIEADCKLGNYTHVDYYAEACHKYSGSKED